MQYVLKDMKQDIVLFVALLAGFAALGGFISHVDAHTDADEQTFCPAVYEPVCGTVEVQCVTAPCPPVLETFGNTCELEHAGAAFYHSGTCKPGETYELGDSSNTGGTGKHSDTADIDKRRATSNERDIVAIRETQPQQAPWSLTHFFTRFPQWLVSVAGRWF